MKRFVVKGMSPINSCAARLSGGCITLLSDTASEDHWGFARLEENVTINGDNTCGRKRGS